AGAAALSGVRLPVRMERVAGCQAPRPSVLVRAPSGVKSQVFLEDGLGRVATLSLLARATPGHAIAHGAALALLALGGRYQFRSVDRAGDTQGDRAGER